MSVKPETFSAPFGRDKIVFEVGKLAPRADASVTVRWGDTTILATAVVSDEVREGVDFFPLLVDYEERFYASGKISGSRFIKREGRPSDNAVLSARIIDRPLRPLFPKTFRNDVQVIITVLSADLEHSPDIIGIIGASCALAMTKAPFAGPISAARVGLVPKILPKKNTTDSRATNTPVSIPPSTIGLYNSNDYQLVLNPTDEQLDNALLNIVVAGTPEKVLMLDASSADIPEDIILQAIEIAQKSFGAVIDVQKDLAKNAPVMKVDEEQNKEVIDRVSESFGSQISEVLKMQDENEQEGALAKLNQAVLSEFEGKFKQSDLKTALETIIDKNIRQKILDEGKRPDNRALDEIRPLSLDIDLLPRVHGSAIFARGETQCLTIATLAGPGAEQMIDTMEEDGTKRYMHHYNFPPFSTGEAKPMRSASRREIGHGALAERALVPVLPSQEDFPYTIRLVSEVLSSNGSSSMAATCASTMALMQAGVPIKAPVAGIAIGLMTRSGFNNKKSAEITEKDYTLLTDIQGVEDFAGDMDYKVTGTKDGVTAIQLDMKVHGLPFKIVKQALLRAKEARVKILQAISKVIAKPNPKLSPYAPRIEKIKIDQKKIGDLIGPGGKTIRSLIEGAGGKDVISIDVDEDGLVVISSTDPEASAKVLEEIKALTKIWRVGDIVEGKVSDIVKNRNTGSEIGAIVQFAPGKDGMVHISQIAPERIDKVSSKLRIGQEVKAKIIEIDAERGRISLSIKALLSSDNQKS